MNKSLSANVMDYILLSGICEDLVDINELYEAALGGDKLSEKKLFENLSEAITHLVEHKVQDRNDAQELVQDIMIVVVEKYRQLAIHSSFAAWVYKVYSNKLKTYYRDKKRITRLDKEYCDMKMQSSMPTENTELRQRVIACLKKICTRNIQYARALNLHHQGYDAAEIGNKLGATPKAVYNILFRARVMLKLCINEAKVGNDE